MVSLTPDIVINSFAIPDENVDIVGFVAEVELPKVVGKTKKYDIMKFVIKNNETSMIQCCIWGMNPIQQYKDQLNTGVVVSIKSAELEAINSRFHRRGLASFEVHISEDSTIEFHGQHEAEDDNPENAIVATFDSIASLDGLIKIEGFISQRFVVKTQGNQRMRYATGSITNGQFKINVKVMDYNANFDHLTKGTKVRVTGTVSVVDNTDIIQIISKNFGSLTVIEGTISQQALMLGVSPKRRIPEA